MQHRLTQEATSFAAWLLGHLVIGLVVAGVTASSGHHSANSVLEIGTEKTQQHVNSQPPVMKETTTAAVNVLVPTDQQTVAVEPRKQPPAMPPPDPLLTPNVVESSPAPTNHLQFTELERIASRYASTCSEKNVRLTLTLRDGTPLQRIGTRYLFRLANGQLVIIDERGLVPDTNVRYKVGVQHADVPPSVIHHANAQIGLAEMRHVRIGLVMDNSVEVQMHRSLYAFLRSSGIGQLQPNEVYQAEVHGTSPLHFRWSHSHLAQR